MTAPASTGSTAPVGGDAAAADALTAELSFVAALGRGHRQRVPTVLQMEAAECGAACLAMMLASFGRWEPLEVLRVECGVSRDGANARSIAEAARRYGLEANGFSIGLDKLAHEPAPVIAYWSFSHFVVVEGASRRGLLINDPAGGRRTVDWAEADRCFTGLVLRMKPTDEFRPGGHRPRVTEALKWRIKGSGKGLAYLAVAGLALALPTMLAPMAIQEFVDQFIVLGLPQWALISVVTMTVGLLLVLWLGYWQQQVALRVALSLSWRQAEVLIHHVLRLPISYYVQRYPGEVAARMGLIDSVSQVVTGQLLPSFLGAVTSAAICVALFTYSWVLATVAVGCAALVAAVLVVATPKREEQALALARDTAMLSGSMTYDLSSIDTLKAIGGEQFATQRAIGRFVNVNQSRNRLLTSAALLGVVPGFAVGAATALIVGFGGLLVARNDLEVGQYVAVIALLPLFLSPISTWVNAATAMQQVRSWLVRLDDVLDQPLDPRCTSQDGAGQDGAGQDGAGQERDQPAGPGAGAATAAATAPPKTAPRITLAEVELRYAPAGRPAVSGVSLLVEPGRSVGIVGASGSGKSSVARMAAGLIPATSGLVESVGTVGYVEQDIVLFRGTVRDNVAMFDQDLPDAQILDALTAAGIAAEVLSRQGGLYSTVTDDGSNFSGGQRQRLEIARVLAARPQFVILDEATSALDPVVEAQVMDNMRNSGAGLLIIAHRLSTVVDCDEIIVMKDGQAVQRGTHEQLLATDGAYRQLVGTP